MNLNKCKNFKRNVIKLSDEEFIYFNRWSLLSWWNDIQSRNSNNYVYYYIILCSCISYHYRVFYCFTCFKLFVPYILSAYEMKNQLMSLIQFYSYIDWSLHVSGPQAHLQESSHSCSHNHWFSIRTVLDARDQNDTDTEPMVVWTAVWTLLKMGLWARNM